MQIVHFVYSLGDKSRVEIDELFESRVSLLLRCSKGNERNLRPVLEVLQFDARYEARQDI